MIAHRNACSWSRFLWKSLSPILKPTCTSTISLFPLCSIFLRQSRTIHLHKQNVLSVPLTRSLTTTSNDANKLTTDGTTLTDVQAYDMIHQLSDAERLAVTKAINQYESNRMKSNLQGDSNSSKWRLQFGNRDNIQTLGSVDPTGSYCAMPDDWLQKKLAEATVKPSTNTLIKVCLVHGLPFIGFGFLDNFLMIIMGDYIEGSIGVYFCLSTMAAVALGNTISDALGLGLTHYVEQFCFFLGMKEPKLTPTQSKMAITQRFASLGRMVGITIGCLLGMCPLLFMSNKKVDSKKAAEPSTTKFDKLNQTAIV